MLIKRFEAESMPEALAQAREALGPDALIVGTRSVRRRRGPFGLLGKPITEITAAIDRERKGSTPGERVTPDASWSPLHLSRALVEPLEDEVRALRTAVERGPQPVAAAPSLAGEVAELRRLARALAAGVDEPRADDPASSYRAAGLSRGLSLEIGARARARMREGTSRQEALEESLAESLEPVFAASRSDVGHQLVIGAPGVGKTTTVAKQVGWLADGNTRIVSTDAHRYGGATGLRAVGKQLGVRVDVATSPEALARIARRRGGRLIVDTPGRGSEDRAALADLSMERAALGDSAQVQLVLSASTKELDLRDQLGRYRWLTPSSLVVTRVDESVDLGNVVNVLLEEETPPLAWIGDGQRIPDDLHPPEPRDFARRVLRACA